MLTVPKRQSAALLPWLKPRMLEWWLPTLATVLFSALFLIDTWQSYRVVKAEAQASLAGYSRSIAAALRNELSRADLVLSDVALRIANERATNVAGRDARATTHVQRHYLALPRRPDTYFANAEGLIVASTRRDLVGTTVASSEAFRAHAEGRDTLHIDMALEQSNPIGLTALSRAVRDAEGRFLGVTTLLISSTLLDEAIQAATPQGDLRITLIDHLGRVYGQRVEPSSGVTPWHERNDFRQHLAGAQAQSFHTVPATTVAPEEMVVFQTIADTDLVVAVSRTSADALSPWSRANVVRAGVLSGALILVFWFSQISLRRQRAMQAAHKRFEALIENSEDIVVIVNKEGRYVWASPSVTRVTGFTPQQVVGQHYSQSLHRDDLPALGLAMHRLQETPEQRISLYSHMYTKSRGWIPIEGVGTAHFDTPGIEGAIVTFRDVSEREARTLALLQSEQMLNQAQNIAALGSWRFDPAKKSFQLSEEARRILGIAENRTVAPAEMRTLIHPDDLPAFDAMGAAALKGEEYDLGHRIVVDGEIRWVHARAHFYFDDFGKLTATVGTLQDVTAQQLAAAHLSELLAFNEKIIAESSVGIVVIDAQGRCILANAAIAQMVDSTRDELQTMNLMDDLDWRQNGIYAIAQQALAAQTTHHHMLDGVSRSGKTISLDVELVPINWKGAPHLLILCKDYTEFLAARRALEDGRRMAEQANRAKSEFLANMSHEIRTPLNAVIGLAQLSLDRTADPTLREYQLQMVQSANALLDVINDILDYSKIEAGQMQLNPQEFSLRDITARVIGLFRQSAGAKALELTTDIDSDVPLRLYGDSVRISQIVINLMANAVKFTESGSVRLHIGRTDPAHRRSASADLANNSQTSPIELSFAVTDTGIGMSQEAVAILFSPFTQADGSITRRYGGTGLGLTISKRLADMMGGQISVTSTPDVGSCFTLTLPLAYRQPSTMTPDALGAGSGLHEPTNIAQRAIAIAGAHILVVEDERVNQMVLERLLNRAGLKVTLARHGGEALELMTKAGSSDSPMIDAVLMDLQMPVMDGFATTRAIRADPRWQALPIIAVTAAVLIHDEASCREAGMNDYIAKPVQPAVLIDALVRAIAPNSLIPAPYPLADAQEKPTAPAPDDETTPITRSERQQRMLTLQTRLAAHEFITVAELSELRSLLGEHQDARTERLRAAISRYDYTQAQAILADLLASLDTAN
jgi:PAS domain S-box-containing protein